MEYDPEDYTTIPVRKGAHRTARDAKPDDETWTEFLHRAAEELDT